MIFNFCKNCKIKYKCKNWKTTIYCSNKCQRDFEFFTKYYNWLQNTGDSWSKRSPARFKRAVIYRDGYKCCECKISEWNDKPLVLELEHKDGNSDNNKPNNLCLICPNCHSQTDTYKSKNKGKGRHFRKIRYAEGKSF